MPDPGIKTALIGNKKPFFSKPVFITRPNLPPLQKLQDVLAELYETKWLTNQGKYHNLLEKQLADYLEVEDCVLFCNGTAALQALTHCLELSGEVITSSFTFPATVHSLSLAGLTPVFADIEPDFYTLEPAKVERMVNDKTSAVLAVNVYGNPCDITSLESMTSNHGLNLCFDSAHALGSTCQGKKIGGFGQAEIFSFHATKLFNTFEGGAITCNDRELCRDLRLYRNFGIADEENVISVGTNAKMSEIHAAVGLLTLPQLPEVIGRLEAIWTNYQRVLERVPGLKTPAVRPGCTINYQYFPVEISEGEFGLSRDEVCLSLKYDNIIARKYFFPACHTFPMYRGLPSARPENLPVTERASRNMLCLPIYASMPYEYSTAIGEILCSISNNADRVKECLKTAV